MFLTGSFQKNIFLLLTCLRVLLVIALVFSSSSALAFQSLEEFSRSRNKISPLKVTALTEPVRAMPGKPFELYLLVTLSKGWHIYSLIEQSSGESLATQIHFDDHVFQAEGKWMEPKPVIALDEALDKIVKVHVGSVRFRRHLRVPDDLSPGEYPISGRIEYRACDNKICTLPREVNFNTRFLVSGDGNGS